VKDTHKHQGLRNHLVKTIKRKGISDQNVLSAIGNVPRHLFMDSGFIDFSYQDHAFPIAADQTISQPYTVAYQTELLQVQPNQHILEIGTGSGYQAAVLIEMGAKVYTIERQKELFKKAKLFLPKLGYKPKKIVFGDGYKGLSENAPFDGIIVTAGAPFVPKPLLEQLKIGGRLVIPVGEDIQTMTLYIRTGENDFEKHELGKFRFVPLLKKKN
jgi:protein-L-isoaspartate(D-aspartate) O-methyltransferase